MKKKIALLLTLAMSAGVVAGCGSSGSTSTSDGAASEAETSTSADATTTTSSGDDTTITFWEQGTDEPDKSLWEYAPDQYNSNDSAESGYTVEVVGTVNDQYKQKLSVAMSAGQCPDMYTHWSGGPMVEYINSGYAQDITDLVDKYGLRDRYTEASLSQATVDGKVYALPVLNDSVAVIFYDKAMWAEKGYEVPTTLDELEALCDKMVSDGVTPFALANGSQWTGSMYYCYLVARYGGPDVITNAYDGSGSLVNDATEFAGEKIEEWVDKGYFPEGVNSLSADNGDDRALLYQGAGMMLHGAWQVGSIKQENPDFYENLGAFAFPVISGKEEYANVVLGTLGDNFISFNCTGDKLEAAVQCAAYYSTEEWMNNAIAAGKMPPLKAATSDEPAWQDILAIINDASSVQLWWDQYLPSAVAEVHKSASQKAFDKSATPTEIAQEQQDALDEYHSENAK